MLKKYWFLVMSATLLVSHVAYVSNASAQDADDRNTDRGAIGSPIPGAQYAPGLGVSHTTYPGQYGGLRVLTPQQGANTTALPNGLRVLSSPQNVNGNGAIHVVGGMPGGGGNAPAGTVVDPTQIDPSLVPNMAEAPPQ